MNRPSQSIVYKEQPSFGVSNFLLPSSANLSPSSFPLPPNQEDLIIRRVPENDSSPGREVIKRGGKGMEKSNLMSPISASKINENEDYIRKTYNYYGQYDDQVSQVNLVWIF